MTDITRRLTLTSLAVAATAAACAQQPTPAPRLTAEAFTAWLERYKAAWENRDASAAGALFSEDASYHEMPFDTPFVGRAEIEAYWARVTAPQSDIRFSHDVIACAGDQGVAHWRAAFNAGGAAVELDGVFVCQFSADASAVVALREWWHVRSTPPG